MKTLEQERAEAEVILRERIEGTSDPYGVRVFDCGRLGTAVFHYDYFQDYVFDWLSWTHVHTLNVPGLDLP